MPDVHYLIAAVAVSGAVTWGLRSLPFTVLGRLNASDTVDYLNSRLPAGVMVILTLYCLRDLPITRPAGLPAPLLALAVTVGLHLWRRNALLSIFAGTAVHVLLSVLVGP